MTVISARPALAAGAIWTLSIIATLVSSALGVTTYLFFMSGIVGVSWYKGLPASVLAIIATVPVLVLVGVPGATFAIDSSPVMRLLLVIAIALTVAYAVESARRARRSTAEAYELAERLSVANRVQYDFLAMVSHELRTPLTMILGNSHFLSRGRNRFTVSERRALAAEVFGEAVGLSRIVDNLLILTRLDRGERLEIEPTVLSHICKKVLREMPNGAERCRFSYPDNLAVVLANTTSVEQVIRNLTSNALKYSPEHEPVDLNLELRDDKVVFSVADWGAGIDSNDRERIFEPFFRAEATATRSGMGLGLTVCMRLMEAMGGSIWAEARDGGGSIFLFALKIEAVEA